MHILLLHNIRSVHNVASIFRTADAAGISKILLSGYSPTPLDRFGKPRSDFAKVSLGAEKTVIWKKVSNPGQTLTSLREGGYHITAIEQDKQAQSLFSWHPPKEKQLAIVLGNEVRGLSKQLLAQADTVLEIPMHGKKESLNVSVAAGISLFTLLHA